MRDRFGRLAVFLLCVVVIAICLGMLLSQLHMPLPVAKNVAIVATVIGAILSYLASYKPGWLYNSLLDAAKGDE